MFDTVLKAYKSSTFTFENMRFDIDTEPTYKLADKNKN